MFFFNSVFLVFYALVYHAEACRKEGCAYFGKSFLRLLKIAGFYLVAVLLASFMLLPNVYGYFNAARSESKGLVSFTSLFGLQALASYFLPIVGGHYSVIAFNLFSTVLIDSDISFLQGQGLDVSHLYRRLYGGILRPALRLHDEYF